jgi:hypothetical protein
MALAAGALVRSSANVPEVNIIPIINQRFFLITSGQ